MSIAFCKGDKIRRKAVSESNIWWQCTGAKSGEVFEVLEDCVEGESLPILIGGHRHWPCPEDMEKV